jgi:uncharacterized ParB-like nuclease family protein
MSADFDHRAETDFSRARFKSFLNRIRSVISGQPSRLLSYDEVRASLRIGGPIYRGIQTVPVSQIAGSLNRYHQFDRAFLPTENQIAPRWVSVDRAFYKAVSLPPVLLYKVGQVYFVVDGHHRVSVAREQGQEFIDAEVRECSTKVNITPDLKPEDLVILGEKVQFLERTRLDQLRPDARVRLTISGGFGRMLKHIAVHRYFMGLDQKQDITDADAVTDWYDTVYMPIVEVVRDSGILEEFPGRTEADLYLWVLDHQQQLAQESGQALDRPQDAARDFLEAQGI